MTWQREIFRANLKTARGKRKLGLAEIGAHLGVKDNTITTWANDPRTAPKITDVVQIAELLDVRPEWLAFGDEFAPMTTEERDVVLCWRKLLAQERSGFSQTLHAITAGRTDETDAKRDTHPPLTQIRRTDHSVPGLAIKPIDAPPSKAPHTAKRLAEEPAPYAVQIEAWEEMSKIKMRSSDFDVHAITAPPENHALPAADIRAAAQAVPLGSGIPPIAETEPADVRFDRRTHYTLKFTGRSMWPKMIEGDRLIVQRLNLFLPEYNDDHGPADPAPWRALDGRIVVALIEDDELTALIKRMEVTHRKDTGFKITLRSDNPAVKSIEITKDNRLRIIGIVREIVRNPDVID